jgi:hypothetical protein
MKRALIVLTLLILAVAVPRLLTFLKTPIPGWVTMGVWVIVGTVLYVEMSGWNDGR